MNKKGDVIVKIEVNYRKLATFDDNFSSLSRKMDHISDKVNKYAKSLDWEVATSDNISTKLSKATRSLNTQSDTLTNMSKFVTKAANTYKEMDKGEKQSKLKNVYKAFTEGIKKIAEGFEKAMGFIGTKITEAISGFGNWLIDFAEKNKLTLEITLSALAIGKFDIFGGVKNNMLFKLVEGDLNFLANKFKIGKFFKPFINKMDNWNDKLIQKVENSKFVNWLGKPGKFEIAKGFVRKTIGELKGLKSFAKGSVLAIVVAGFDIKDAVIETLKDDSLSDKEKAKRIFVDAGYIATKAVIVTAVSTAVTAAATIAMPFISPVGTVGVSLVAGLATEWAMTKVERVMKKTLDVAFDLAYNNRTALLQATLLPIGPQKFKASTELMDSAAKKIQTELKPLVEAICKDPQQKQVITEYIDYKHKFLEMGQLQNQQMASHQLREIEIDLKPMQFTINNKVANFNKAYAV